MTGSATNKSNRMQIILGIVLGLSLKYFVSADTTSLTTDRGEPEVVFYSMIFPGTKWCGPGNIANGYDDLGVFQKTDICCRDHDHCDNIPPNEEKYGLKNNYMYSRLHCRCDKNFYDCLHNNNDTVSNTVGRTYFQFSYNCFREDHPASDCLETETSLFDRRCVKYSYDKTKSKKYQWFDLPYYTSTKFPDLKGSESESKY